MGLRILHSADWHLGAASSSGASQRQLPGCIGGLARGCDLALLAGDLFHGQPSKELVELVKGELARWEIPVFISPGNHDYCGTGSPWLEEDWPENVHIFTGAMESVVLPWLDCRVYGAGYRQMDCPPPLEGFRAEGQERYCVGIFHGDGVNHTSPYAPVTAAQVRDSGFDYLALGHIHKAGSFRAGSTLCGWPGCPMGQGWDETGEKGVYVVTLEETADLAFHPLGFAQYHREELEVSGDARQALEAYLPAGGNGDFYQITLMGEGEADIPGLLKVFSRFPNLELIDRLQPPLDLWAEAGEDSLRGVYFSMLRQSEDPRAKLAAEISQRLLKGWEVKLP